MANPLITLNGLDDAKGVQSAYSGFKMGEDISQAPLRNSLLDAQVQGAELSNQNMRQQMSRADAEFMLKDAAIDAMRIKELAQVDPMRAQVAIADRIKKIVDRGGDPSDTIGVRELLTSGNTDAFNAELDAVISGAQQAELLGRGNAAIREFESKAAAAGLKPGTPEYEKAAMIDLGMSPRAGSITGQERIAGDENLTRAVAGSQATIEGEKSAAKEKGKLETQAALLPKIRADIKEAEAAAQERGETLSAYNRAKAALPGLQEVVGKLKALSDVATYTTKGKVWDSIVKEMGFGATEGATARSTMESIVDNQVLPLLRDTFGAAFTAAEGERLRNTMLDPDLAPEQKKASLDAFIDQKMRNLEGQERELGVNGTGSQPGQVGRFKIRVK